MSDLSETPKGLYAPRAWLSWLGFGLIRIVIHLPYSWVLALSNILSYPLYLFAIRRRKIADINLELCFPEMTKQERKRLIRQHFASGVTGLFEMGMAWWLPNKRLENMMTIEGQEHLESALAKGKGVLLISPHFTCLEIIGRLFQMKIDHPWSGMYRPHENPVIEYFFRRRRSSFFSSLIARDDIRSFVKELKKNQIVWFATDQNFRSKGLVMAPFFGVDTMSHSGTSRIVKMTGGTVVPMGYRRRKDKPGYVIKFYPPPENYPSEDEVENATIINRSFETMILDALEQYFWLHRKFKIRGKKGVLDVYRQRGI